MQTQTIPRVEQSGVVLIGEVTSSHPEQLLLSVASEVNVLLGLGYAEQTVEDVAQFALRTGHVEVPVRTKAVPHAVFRDGTQIPFCRTEVAPVKTSFWRRIVRR